MTRPLRIKLLHWLVLAREKLYLTANVLSLPGDEDLNGRAALCVGAASVPINSEEVFSWLRGKPTLTFAT